MAAMQSLSLTNLTPLPQRAVAARGARRSRTAHSTVAQAPGQFAGRAEEPSASSRWSGVPSAQAAPQQEAQAAAPSVQEPIERNSSHSLPQISKEEMSRTVRGVVLAGGETKNPLTKYRAMPAVPLGSSLLMVDVPLNNCLQAGINKIYVLTQFQSHTLNSHIASSYPPRKFGKPDQQSWVDVLAAQQTVTEREWYRGSADAIRKNLGELKDQDKGITPACDYVILSGSAVYNMDFSKVVAFHREKNADITIAMHTCDEALARTKGIARVHPSSGKIMKFMEKPSGSDLSSLRREDASAAPGSEFLANMGIYVFKREALFSLMDRPQTAHIGHHVIPNALAQEMKVYAYEHDGYWHDVSSLKDFFETNLDLACPDALMGQIDDMSARRSSSLPPAMMHDVELDRVIVGDGSVLVGCKISNSVLGDASYVGRGTIIENALLLGNGAWMSESNRKEAIEKGEQIYGVGENCFLRRCVVDENAIIGNNCQIINMGGVVEADRSECGYMIQDGIVVIMRNAVIPDGVVI